MERDYETDQLPIARWEKAQTTNNTTRAQKKLNERTENEYHIVLNAVKELHKTIGTEIAFERNYKTHHSDNSYAIHLFITKSFYWYLVCDECYNYLIHYELFNCQFENEVKALLASLPFNRHIETTIIQPNLPTAFKRYQRVEAAQFINLLY